MTRSALPHRRAQETFDLQHDEQRYSVSLGFYGDGTPGEVFIQAHRRGTTTEAIARDTAIVLSFAMQHGLPLAEVRRGLTRDRQGAPTSIIGAVLDAMAGPRDAPA